MVLCSICKKRPAVIFISLAEGEAPLTGLCLRCAQKMSAEAFREFTQLDNFPVENIEKLGTQIAGIVSAVDDVQNLGDIEESQGGGEIGRASCRERV